MQYIIWGSDLTSDHNLWLPIIFIHSSKTFMKEVMERKRMKPIVVENDCFELLRRLRLMLARIARRVVERSANQPSHRPTNQEEAQKPSGCQSLPNRRAVEMPDFAFYESDRCPTSYIFLVICSRHPPNDDHQYRSVRYPVSVLQMGMRTWAILVGIISQW